MTALRLGTRRSPLALAQTAYVAARLRERGVETTVIELETSGDRRRHEALSSLGGQGVFAVEIQRALLDREVDAAVHSAKDLPSTSPEGLVIACVPERRDAADVLVGRSLAGLGPGASVATGSPRRRALLLERRPDLNVVELRGNMATRLARAGTDVDAVIAAAAALERLGEGAKIAERLDPTWFVPQVGQGALAIETRHDDDEVRGVLALIDDEYAHAALRAERSFLATLGAGCTVPAGAHATHHAGELALSGVMLASDGSLSVRAVMRGADPEELGARLATHLADERHGRGLAGWA
jgi:hydroxymethylbilane synthase